MWPHPSPWLHSFTNATHTVMIFEVSSLSSRASFAQSQLFCWFLTSLRTLGSVDGKPNSTALKTRQRKFIISCNQKVGLLRIDPATHRMSPRTPISLPFCSTFCRVHSILCLLRGPLADPGLPLMATVLPRVLAERESRFVLKP